MPALRRTNRPGSASDSRKRLGSLATSLLVARLQLETLLVKCRSLLASLPARFAEQPKLFPGKL
eukprot:942009-Pyramimonas_sp.AAC.1